MPADANLVLVGFMGTGKTEVGRRLATRMGREFVDMDRLIETREGRSIPAIFRDSGEAYFRALERALARELSGRRSLVIAAGGGIVLQPDNVADFLSSGVVVCLMAAPEAIIERVAGDTGRPLLSGPDPAARVRELLARRRPLYEAIADRIDTTGRTPDEVADAALAIFQSRAQTP